MIGKGLIFSSTLKKSTNPNHRQHSKFHRSNILILCVCGYPRMLLSCANVGRRLLGCSSQNHLYLILITFNSKLQPITVGGTNGMIISFICRKLKTNASAYNKAVKIKVSLNKAHSFSSNYQASFVAICIILTFFITWLPNQVTSLIIYMQAIKWIEISTPSTLNNIHRLSTCLLFVSSSINPFLYAFYGQRLRKAILNRVILVIHQTPKRKTPRLPSSPLTGNIPTLGVSPSSLSSKRTSGLI